MSSRILLKTIFGIVLLTVILACSLVSAPTTSSPTLSAATAQIRNGIPVFASPIRLVIPDGLATGASAKTISAVTDQTGAPWDIAPAHLQLTFQGYPPNGSFHVPQLFVYPAQDYATANPSAAESIKRLQAVLSNPNAQYTNDQLPYVPFFNAGQVFAAQEKIIQFNGGAGIRIVTQYAQDVSPINNGSLFYHFEGLTSDGKYYIVAILPTRLSFLPADNNPGSPVPSGGIAFPQNNASGVDYENYFKQITDKINAAQPDQFSSSLTSLDSLVQSMTINP
ncbi:MAG TPA: hypothetical protein VIN60_01035 [Anaerolineales bacterium]